MTQPHNPEARERILEGTSRAICAAGVHKTSLEDIAREAGCSRATVYRYFPGGRDQLVGEAVTWEVAGFFTRLAAHVEDAADFRERLERGLAFAHRSLAEHVVFQSVLATERERLLVRLDEVAPLTLGVVRGYLAAYLADEELAPGVEVDGAADYLARMVISFLGSPGSWDLEDPDEVAELVESVFLAGVLADRA